MMSLRLRLGGYQPETSVHTRAGRVFTALLREIGFDATFEADVTQRGHRAAELLDMVERGDLDACYFASSYLAGRVPSLNLLDLPFPTGDRLAAHGEVDGAAGSRIAQGIAAATGFRVLAFWDNGFRHISNRLRPIRRPDDCRG